MNSRPIRIKPDLLIVAWNANGLASRYAELVDATWYKPDVILVGETRLNPDNRFLLPNYIFFLKDRLGRAGGGTAIMVRPAISSLI